MSFYEESDPGKKSLFMNKDQSDVILKVEEKEYYCHKEILSAGSKFFHEMFQSFLFKNYCLSCY